jgi:tRNA(Ile)-lysidine synthase
MSDDPLHHGLRAYIRRLDLVERGESILVAVSGGSDSIVLLELLACLRTEMKLSLAVAHFNHELRGRESDEDEAFVRTAAREHQCEFYVERANTRELAEAKKRSLQEEARDLRYLFFDRLRKSLGFQKVATAHHADDNAETVLFNFLRGTGIHGLAGIPAHRRDRSIIRPLLFATREEIRAYAERHGLRFREDSSNAKTEYTRNFMRQALLPTIKDNVNPNIVATLRRSSEIFDELQRYVRGETDKLRSEVVRSSSPTEIILDAAKLLAQPRFLQEMLILTIAREFTQAEIDTSAVRAVLGVARSETGSACSLTKDHVAARDRDCLVFRRPEPRRAFQHPVELGRSYAFEGFSFSSAQVPAAAFTPDPNVEFVDGASLGRPLVLRSWHQGDSFIPLGMNDRKKVSDFFIDEKVPLHEKPGIPLLVCGDDIVWVCGRRIDERCKVTPKSSTIIKLEFSPRT